MRFSVVTHKDETLAHKLEVGLLLVKFGFPYFTGPFLRDYEELGCSRKAFEIFKIEGMKLVFIFFQVQYDGAYPLEFYDPPPMILACVLSPVSRCL